VPPEGNLTVDQLRDQVTRAKPVPRQPFSRDILAFCSALGSQLFRSGVRGSQLQSLGCFMREARFSELRDQYLGLQVPGVLFSPRGVVSQIPPNNVAPVLLDSWLMSAVTGNIKLIRLPGTSLPDLDSIVDVFNDVSRQWPGGDPSRTFIVRYDHDDQVTAALSDLCDVRVLWGDDCDIRALRTIQIPPPAKGITFSDKHSLTVISAEGYLSLSSPGKDRLVQHFYADMYLFDQMACSLPRLVVWIGPQPVCQEASPEFYTRLAIHSSTRYVCELGAVVSKRTFACMATLDQGIRSQSHYSNELTVLGMGELNRLTREHCGGGLLFEYFANELDELNGFVSRKDQRLTYFGLPFAVLDQFASRLDGRAIDRIVPIGQALSFSHIWDGYDLLQEFVRRTQITGTHAPIHQPTVSTAA